MWLKVSDYLVNIDRWVWLRVSDYLVTIDRGVWPRVPDNLVAIDRWMWLTVSDSLVTGCMVIVAPVWLVNRLQPIGATVTFDRETNGYKVVHCLDRVRAQEVCESRGGRPGLLSLINLQFLLDVKQHFNFNSLDRCKPEDVLNGSPLDNVNTVVVAWMLGSKLISKTTIYPLTVSGGRYLQVTDWLIVTWMLLGLKHSWKMTTPSCVLTALLGINDDCLGFKDRWVM